MAGGITDTGDDGASPGVNGESLFDRDHRNRIFGALELMSRVIFAVIMRESRTRYGHSDLGYAWAIIDPLIEMAILLLIFTSFGRTSGIDASLPVFLVTGIMPYYFWKNCMSRAASAASANAALLTYPQVKVADIIIGRTILEAVTSTVVYFFFVIGLLMVMGEPLTSWFDDPLQMVLALLMTGYFGLSSAFFNAGLTRVLPAWGNIWSYLSRPLWFLSGVFYTLEALPHGARGFMVYIPMAHMIEWLRSASLPGFESSHYSPVYLFCVSTIVLFIGLVIDRVMTVIGQNTYDA